MINATSSNTTYMPTIYTNSLIPNDQFWITSTSSSYLPTSSSSSIFASSQNIIVELKKCRTCNHAHIEGQKGCIDTQGWTVSFVPCSCEEYLPKDNLEYLEKMYDKNKKYK